MCVRLFLVLVCALTSVSGYGQTKTAEIPASIPLSREFQPREEQPVFAVCSKQGTRVLMSYDDGRTWEQTFLATDELEDGGWHGSFAVYGMAATNGMLGVFSGWGPPGVYLASDDGRNWAHFGTREPIPPSLWDAAAGNGIFLTSADQWRGVSSTTINGQQRTQHSLKELLDGGKTHHVICGFGEYGDGCFLAVGDNRHVFFSHDNCRTWQHSMIPETAGEQQQAVAFGNGVFVCAFPTHVARSADGGVTWTAHPHGLTEGRLSWRGLSFVRGQFWLTERNGKVARGSSDGITWQDLPVGTPGGRFVQSQSGTLINVERGRYDIRRSEDGVEWESVFTAPEQNVTWDTAFAVATRLKKSR